MGLFRPYKRDGEDATPASAADKQVEAKTLGPKPKGPTPTRKEAEAARMARLNPTPTKKEAKQRERERRVAQQAKAFTEQERQPERVLARNFVDARWTLAEFVMPLLIILLVLSMIGTRWLPLVRFTTIAMYGLLIGMILEFIFLWHKFKQELFARYPNASKRGLFMYLSQRAMQPRRWRRPGTAINRGDPY